MKTKFETDDLMRNLFRLMYQDMRTCLKFEGDLKYAESVEISRTRKLLLTDNMDPYTYKWMAQLSSFLKRYTFQNDLISPAEREEVTNVKFIELQKDLASIYGRRRSLRLHTVLTKVRSHTRRILAGFSPKELTQCQFGTKSTVGCPLSHAYIDEKLLYRPITGSAMHLQWFENDYLDGDSLLSTIISGTPREVIGKLKQVNVPKKYNIDRGINPNTLLGSLYTSGLGRVVEDALRKEGLDIRRLQQHHRRLVKYASIKTTDDRGRARKRSATADLSNASHGFLSHHLNSMLPREWYNACMKGVIREVEVGQRVIRLESIMTMGIGFTFPMQTLLFYCLLLSLRDLTGIRGLISVYGDDLIYPQDLHPYVVDIFTELGFKLNLDKTFVESPFRESCGADFFNGVDVRPFAPEGQSRSLSRTQYGAFCYKMLNGLLMRWNECEIQSMFTYLIREVHEALGCVFYVPLHFPDFSGFKVRNPALYIDNPGFLYENGLCGVTKFCNELHTMKYTHLAARPRKRYVANQSPYLWEWLRSRSTVENDPEKPVTPDTGITPVFKWVTKKKNKKTVTLLSTGKAVKERFAVVDQKSTGTVAQYEVVFAHACSPHADEKQPV